MVAAAAALLICFCFGDVFAFRHVPVSLYNFVAESDWRYFSDCGVMGARRIFFPGGGGELGMQKT